MTQTSPALVIRTVDFSETSKIATLFCRDLGKLGVMAKGARRLKSPFNLSLDLLSVLDICVIRKPSAELDLLTEALLRERFPGLRENLKALYAGYYLAELLDGMTQNGDPLPGLYDESVQCLARLSNGEDVLIVLGRFQMRLLAELGYGLSLERCVRCDAPAPKTTRMTLSLPLGGVLCENCVRPKEGALQVHGGTVETLKVMALPHAEPSRNIVLKGAARGEVWRTASSAIEFHLGRRPKTASLVTF